MALPAANVSPQKQVSGSNGMVGIKNGAGVLTQFAVMGFEFTWAVALDNTTNSAGGGWGDQVPGTQTIVGTLTFVYDLANNPNISPQQMTPGTVATLALIADGQATANALTGDTLGTETWTGLANFGEMKVASGPNAGPCNCSTTFKNKGPWTNPSA